MADSILKKKKNLHPLRGEKAYAVSSVSTSGCYTNVLMKEVKRISSPLSAKTTCWLRSSCGRVIVIVRLVTSFPIHSMQLCWRSALCRWSSSPSISYSRIVTTGISNMCLLLLSYLLSSCQHRGSSSGQTGYGSPRISIRYSILRCSNFPLIALSTCDSTAYI